MGIINNWHKLNINREIVWDDDCYLRLLEIDMYTPYAILVSTIGIFLASLTSPAESELTACLAFISALVAVVPIWGGKKWGHICKLAKSWKLALTLTRQLFLLYEQKLNSISIYHLDLMIYLKEQKTLWLEGTLVISFTINQNIWYF